MSWLNSVCKFSKNTEEKVVNGEVIKTNEYSITFGLIGNLLIVATAVGLLFLFGAI